MRSFQEITSKDLFGKPAVSIKSERAQYVYEFFTRINAQRKREQQKALKVEYIAFRLGHLTIQDMHAFLKKCTEADNFNRCFFGLLKVK